MGATIGYENFFFKKMPTGRQGRRIGPQYIIPGLDVRRALSRY